MVLSDIKRLFVNVQINLNLITVTYHVPVAGVISKASPVYSYVKAQIFSDNNASQMPREPRPA